MSCATFSHHDPMKETCEQVLMKLLIYAANCAFPSVSTFIQSRALRKIGRFTRPATTEYIWVRWSSHPKSARGMDQRKSQPMSSSMVHRSLNHFDCDLIVTFFILMCLQWLWHCLFTPKPHRRQDEIPSRNQ